MKEAGTCAPCVRKRDLGSPTLFDTTLPLELGQQIRLCCLDEQDRVAQGDFYPYVETIDASLGRFCIVAPNLIDEASFSFGEETANLCRVLKGDVRVGDEIAIQPAKTKLAYKGQYLPVTDLVYIAFGVGIVPVLEQVRTVLPKGSSSVRNTSVLWINQETKDFDVIAELLEKEYNQYRTKLAVSCIVEDLTVGTIADSIEISEAIPDFVPGTMAVVAGPQAFMDMAVEFLEDRAYPSDTICLL
jgi:hypothetical protein